MTSTQYPAPSTGSSTSTVLPVNASSVLLDGELTTVNTYTTTINGNGGIAYLVATDNTATFTIGGTVYTVPAGTITATTATVGASTSVTVNGPASAQYWAATLLDPTTVTHSTTAQGVGVDSSGNVYTGGYGYDASNNPIAFVSKYNSSGTIQWQTTFTNSTNNINIIALTADSSGNCYVTGSVYYSSGVTAPYVAKISTSGSVTWKIELVGATVSSNNYGYGIAVDVSGNVYVTGNYWNTSFSPAAQSVFVAKIGSTGTIAWSNGYFVSGAGSTDSYPIQNGVAVDSSGNVYLSCNTDAAATGSPYQGVLVKFNSSGTVQYQTSTTTSNLAANYVAQGSIVADSSGNVYMGFNYGLNGTNQITGALAIFDSSGNYTFYKQIFFTNYSNGFNYIKNTAIDASGNIYIVGYIKSNAGLTVIGVAKFNNSGTLQWTRTLTDTYSAPSDQAYGIAVDSNSIYVSGNILNSSGQQVAVVVKIPQDGSLTGTYSGSNFGIVYGTPTGGSVVQPTVNATVNRSFTISSSVVSNSAPNFSNVSSSWTTGFKSLGATYAVPSPPTNFGIYAGPTTIN